jgi:hypothetical protein
MLRAVLLAASSQARGSSSARGAKLAVARTRQGAGQRAGKEEASSAAAEAEEGEGEGEEEEEEEEGTEGLTCQESWPEMLCC